MPEQLHNPAEVQRYLAEALSTDRLFQITECRHGWVCRPVPTPEEIAQDRGFGAGNYVVNRGTGVVTAHRSVPPELIGQEYDDAIRTGRPIPGYRIHPH